MTDTFIAELLRWGVATEDQVAKARTQHATSGGLLPTHLIAAGVRSVDVLSALWAQTGIPIAPASMMRDAERSKSTWSVNPRAAWRHLAVPIGLHEGDLRIAYANPTVAAQTGKSDLPSHKPMLAEEARVRELLVALFGVEPTSVPSTLPSSLEEALAAAQTESGTFERPPAAQIAALASAPAAATSASTETAPAADPPPSESVEPPAQADAPASTDASTAAPRFPVPALDETGRTRPSPASSAPRRDMTARGAHAEAATSKAWIWWLIVAIALGAAFVGIASKQKSNQQSQGAAAAP